MPCVICCLVFPQIAPRQASNISHTSVCGDLCALTTNCTRTKLFTTIQDGFFFLYQLSNNRYRDPHRDPHRRGVWCLSPPGRVTVYNWDQVSVIIRRMDQHPEALPQTLSPLLFQSWATRQGWMTGDVTTPISCKTSC